MGKKTNWTSAEDHTLCRVWLSASELQLHNGDQKASSFWNVTRELYHQEVETAVERPMTGLKVRWTRINRDSQKFAAIFNDIQHKGLRQTENGDAGDAAAVALLTEQQWIDQAKDIFQRVYNTRFSFESCWKQLRYSNKWMQLYANSCSNPNLAMNALSTAVVTQEEKRGRAASAGSEKESTVDQAATMPASSPPRSQETSCVAVNQAPSGTVTPASHKRQAEESVESLQNQNQLQNITTTLIEELKRQNDLMADQNSIALLKIDSETIADEEARHCYELLKARYLKKSRSKTSTLV
ncbi:Glutathione S-transferase [Phytophthora megakarya]|uniref:Glutathione S-transferase n=1 Tax=Phytophthora megakarya TaxID=4795 RepID=A0A225W167_9STRA|nr:Glutathione S-transferase [Phytophthora megakarya]